MIMITIKLGRDYTQDLINKCGRGGVGGGGLNGIFLSYEGVVSMVFFFFFYFFFFFSKTMNTNQNNTNHTIMHFKNHLIFYVKSILIYILYIRN
ncbi:hypothetical protein DDB_G0285945 [Dictyostelium discoideum AX4]|nr:hypothetical protein DDB_G0285945 [Dictyostelium discoideum AX4]EAL64507.1 hypothetical protein DDB_G0285945 [Dictyostelium discoideum AX4]|eukprot:XP_637978.1 hypothetical protein DDB_G0285945 [Dictyostelium discoideum AX4]